MDDWALRRRPSLRHDCLHLERRRFVELLPDRKIETVAASLVAHPGVRVVSHDRGGGYGKAAAWALPNAIQVVDRRHLMENASSSSLEAVANSVFASWRRIDLDFNQKFIRDAGSEFSSLRSQYGFLLLSST